MGLFADWCKEVLDAEDRDNAVLALCRGDEVVPTDSAEVKPVSALRKSTYRGATDEPPAMVYMGSKWGSFYLDTPEQ